MKYKITLLGIVFFTCILFFYNNLTLLNLNEGKEKILFELSVKNKNVKNFYNNLSFFKSIIKKCTRYNYESFSKFCSMLKEKNFIKDLCILKSNENLCADQYLKIFNKIFNIIHLEIKIVADKEEFITRFIDMLLSNDFFVYWINNCIIWEEDHRYLVQLKMNLVTIDLGQDIGYRDFACIDKKDYPLKIIDRRICYTGLIEAGLHKRVYIDDMDISECFPKNTKFSLTKCTDSFIILYINRLKKNLQLFLGKEGHIHP